MHRPTARRIHRSFALALGLAAGLTLPAAAQLSDTTTGTQASATLTARFVTYEPPAPSASNGGVIMGRLPQVDLPPTPETKTAPPPPAAAPAPTATRRETTVYVERSAYVYRKGYKKRGYSGKKHYAAHKPRYRHPYRQTAHPPRTPRYTWGRR